eukprot:1439025-Pleurochrysis_carterae.AAC.1
MDDREPGARGEASQLRPAEVYPRLRVNEAVRGHEVPARRSGGDVGAARAERAQDSNRQDGDAYHHLQHGGDVEGARVKTESGTSRASASKLMCVPLHSMTYSLRGCACAACFLLHCARAVWDTSDDGSAPRGREGAS